MTSRLKHKLELDNVNLNRAYLNESFVLIGTPLPALSQTKKDQLEYVPVWQQEVRDEKGRRRFHGAFEGGWSAGYFNSVGSKEGWAPSTFKSSRNNRANKTQRAEDFMDEEDLQQMNDDRKLENTETFQNEAFAGERQGLGEKSIPSSLESLIAPARSSIGQKLLTKLGWRPGQGIGPRVTLRKLRLQEGKLGRIRVGMEDGDEEMAEEVAGKHTFAPRDAKLLVYEAKEDKEGLGYEKGRGMEQLSGRRGPEIPVGEPDDDDEDPYGERELFSERFAFERGEAEEDVIVMGGPSLLGPGGSKKIEIRSEDNRGDTDRWHDGRAVLPAFALDPTGVPSDKWFEMPEVPEDWRPRPARVWGTTRKFDEGPDYKPEEKEVIRGEPGKPLTFEQRGAALGEEQRLSHAKSVFEYISEKDRERLASIAASAKSTAPPPLAMEPETEEGAASRATEVVVPPLSPRTASAALKGFIPYGDESERQERYRSYLVSQTHNTKSPNPALKTGTVDEINMELDDFAASARIFKPMSFALSNRFTAGSSTLASTDLKQAKPGLHIYDAEKAKAEAAKPKIAEVEVKKILTPREEAAYNGMYGKLTRVVNEFYPVKLLCKRFGVADPHPEGEPAKIDIPTGTNAGYEAMALPKNDASWEDQFIHQPGDTPAANSGQGAATAIGEPEEERRPRTIAEVGMAEDANQGRDTLSYTKPTIDIFKAIFASDDEDDDDDDEEAKVDAPMPKVDQDPYPVKPEGPVDLTTFKPVFSIRRDDDGSGGKSKERRKEKKEKKKRKGVLSFDVGEEGDEEQESGKREEKKRRKKQKDGQEDKSQEDGEQRVEKVSEDVENGGGEWVEKPSIDPRMAGRKGAADFM